MFESELRGTPWSSPGCRWNELSWTQSVPVGKRVAIPFSGECPEPFSKMAFIGIGMGRSIQYACKAHQSMSKCHSYRKQISFIGNSRRNIEICLRGSGSVRHTDARWLLRRGSRVQEFTSSALDLDIWFTATGLSKASLKGYNAFFRPDFPREPSVLVSGHACLQHSRRSGQDSQDSFKALPMQDYSLQYHTKWSLTVSQGKHKLNSIYTH